MGKRAWQYPEATGITNDDVILLDSPTGGSRSIKANKIGSVLINKTLTERGTFDATDDNVDGYKKVTVDVPYTDVEVASGPVASWDDGEDLPLKSLTSFIEPQQEGSGDPSPTNVRPITGWTEANVVRSSINIWDEQWEVGAISNLNGENYSLAERVRSKNYISVKPNTPYYLYLPNTYSSARIACYDKDKEYLGQATGWLSVNNNTAFTTPSNTYYIRFMVVKTDETYNNDISINYPSTDTSYHAYNGQTITIDLDGTRYGGTLDVVSGVLTVDRASATVDENSNIISGSGGLPFRIDLLTGAKASSSASALTGVKCNFLKEVTQSSSWGVDGTFSRVTTNAKIVYFKVNSEITTIQQLKTFLQSNNLQFVYELATPLTIQLTPTQVKSLLGTNNVWADTGDVDVEYQKIWVRPSA